MKFKSIQPPQDTVPSPRAFRGFESLYDGLMSAGGSARILTCLSSVTPSQEGESALGSAVSLFLSLSLQEQSMFLDHVTERLNGIGSLTFMDADSVKEGEILSAFIRRTARQAPAGRLRHEGMEQALAEIAGSSFSPEESATANSAALRLSCTMTLWTLGYGEPGFWASRLSDPDTRGYSIDKLLEASHFDGRGILQNLMDDPEIRKLITDSHSTSKGEFLKEMLQAENPNTAVAALQAAVYLDTLPAGFETAAARLSQSNHPASMQAAKFLEVHSIMTDMGSSDAKYVDGAMRLLELYNGGQAELEGRLKDVGAKVSRAGSGEHSIGVSALLARLDAAGFDVPDMASGIETDE